MRRRGLKLFYLVLIPTIMLATAIVGYYAWRAAGQFARLGAETIAQSTLLIVSEKVDQVEQEIISADNAVFDLVTLDNPQSIEETWPSVAAEISPSVRAVLILDDAGNPEAYSIRASSEEKREFLKLFMERVLPELELERQRLGRLKHYHQEHGDTSYLFSYKALNHGGRRRYAVLHHDCGWIVRERFPSLFATEAGKRIYNVMDENNQRVYGPSLARAGDYVMGRRFPTTLYAWRLQVAPKQAPLLDAQGKSKKVSEATLVGSALVVLLFGMAFVLYGADKERRLNILKAEFIANVSHELKTPLSVVRMFAELLLTKRVRSEDKQVEYLEIICRESERLTALIENVLDFAALERGKRSYAMESSSLVEIVHRAIETSRYRIERGGVDVELHLAANIAPIEMDEQAVFLAVMNLLDNAIKYGGSTPVELHVEATDHEVCVRVRDRGPGIPPEDLKRIFDRFYRSHRTTPTRGSGIGLALVQQIAVAHGGRAWAENAPDGGAIVSFSIRIPREGATVGAQGREAG